MWHFLSAQLHSFCPLAVFGRAHRWCFHQAHLNQHDGWQLLFTALNLCIKQQKNIAGIPLNMSVQHGNAVPPQKKRGGGAPGENTCTCSLCEFLLSFTVQSRSGSCSCESLWSCVLQELQEGAHKSQNLQPTGL